MLSNLPDIPDDFVGRGPELACLEEALVRHRLVTLTGVGGVGKSRLALQAAHALRRTRDRAVIWADLWPLRDDRFLTAAVADASGFADHTAAMPLDALCEWLANRDALLVLDSCEHLLGPCRHLAAHLIMTCPSLTVLATSREPLQVPGEHILTVHPLPPTTDAPDLLRSRAATAGAPLTTPADHAAALRLCRRLEGIPLALELVAGHLSRRRTIHQVERTLVSRLHLHAASPGTPAGPPRHRTLRTAIGWSHELCTPQERLLWARLTVFRDTLDPDAVRAVCGTPPLTPESAERVLSALAAKSIVSRTPNGTYRMLDTVRDYGALWLTELGERDDMTDRHAAHFLRLARTAHRAWLGPDQATWYRRINHAHTDLCAALDHFLDTRPRSAVEMSGLLAFFWTCCGHLREAADYVSASLELCAQPGKARTRAQWALGVTHVLRGEYETADALATTCHAEAEDRHDPEAALQATYLQALTSLLQGRPMTARWLVDTALTAPSSSTSQGRLMCRLVRVFALTAEGHLADAREEAERLHKECETHGEWWTRSYAAYQLALIAVFEDRTDDAAAHARHMLRGKRHLGDSFGLAMGLDLLAAVLASQGAAKPAVSAYAAAETYWSATGHPQRGAPELAHLRSHFTQTARRLLGPSAYETFLDQSLRDDPDAVLRHLLDAAPDEA